MGKIYLWRHFFAPQNQSISAPSPFPRSPWPTNAHPSAKIWSVLPKAKKKTKKKQTKKPAVQIPDDWHHSHIASNISLLFIGLIKQWGSSASITIRSTDSGTVIWENGNIVCRFSKNLQRYRIGINFHFPENLVAGTSQTMIRTVYLGETRSCRLRQDLSELWLHLKSRPSKEGKGYEGDPILTSCHLYATARSIVWNRRSWSEELRSIPLQRWTQTSVQVASVVLAAAIRNAKARGSGFRIQSKFASQTGLQSKRNISTNSDCFLPNRSQSLSGNVWAFPKSVNTALFLSILVLRKIYFPSWNPKFVWIIPIFLGKLELQLKFHATSSWTCGLEKIGLFMRLLSERCIVAKCIAIQCMRPNL